VAAWFSLFGAYYPPGDPLASRPFAVDLLGPDDLSALLRGDLAVRARVRAEGLANDPAATARLSLCFPDLLCKLTFLSDAGCTQEAVVVTRFGRRILRTLTELSGTVCGRDGTSFGLRLRVNWRVFAPRPYVAAGSEIT
jgi:hypothetical protein